METIVLKNFITENINEDHLNKCNLKPWSPEEWERQMAWKKEISGSKIKDVLARPRSLLAYYLGWITEQDFEGALRAIPRMNYYRDYGANRESSIVDEFNTAIANEWLDNPKLMTFRDLLIDSPHVYRMRTMFAPNAGHKEYIKVDKRSFLLNVPGAEDSNIFMANIDGYTTNPDGSIKHIIEIKTKTGAVGEEGQDRNAIINLHIDQITFYNKILKATDGAILLIDHNTRGLKVHKFEQHELDRHWAKIWPKIAAFAEVYIELLKDNPDVEKAISLLSKLKGSDKEVIKDADLIAKIRSMGGGVYE